MGVLTLTLADPEPGAAYDLTVPEARGELPIRWRSLPDRIDGPESGGVSFLFGSCFWRNNDREGAYEVGVRDLTKLWNPVFKLLMGDQVYQDWPVDVLRDDSPVRRYADRYAEYWGDPGYQRILTAQPNFFMADDHEFWNDYPERQWHLARSWMAEDRARYGRAADDLYWYYQRCANPGPGTLDPDQPRWYSFAVGQVGFFVADTRSVRTSVHDGDPHFMSQAEWRDLEAWAAALQGPGVLVLGQPMFSGFGGTRDHKLPDFADDYGRLCRLFEGTAAPRDAGREPHDILMLSGDIHVGRHCLGRFAASPSSVEVHELVSSASSQIGRMWKPDPKSPPTKLAARFGSRSFTWHVEMTREADVPTVDNNLGLVRMSAGTNGRVRFELSIYRVRPYDQRSWVSRLFRGRVPQGPVIRLFHREIELR
jgi:hypothetical protein